VEQVPILVVDDRRANLVALEAALEGSTYEIVLAHSGTDALGKLLARQFAVILLDVAMPELDGYETARMIRSREKTRHIPIVFVTAHMSEAAQIFQGYEHGAVDYLVKPLDIHALKMKVSVFAELYRYGRRLEEASRSLAAAEHRARMVSEALYDVTFEEAPIGIGHVSDDIRWLRVNARMASILGRTPEELRERSMLAYVHNDDRERLAADMKGVLAGQTQRHQAEYRLVGRDDQAVWIHLTVSLIRDPEGKAVQLTIIDNMSEEKRLRATSTLEVQRSLRARDDFVSVLAHELRNPLTPLLMQIATLRSAAASAKEPLDPVWVDKQLAVVQRATSRLARLSEELLTVSRSAVGGVTLEPEELDFVALVREVVVSSQPDLARARCELTVDADATAFGFWDRLALERVVTQLLSNAMKYGAGRPIEVSVHGEDGGAVLSVRDHGIGITPEQRAQLFERFSRQSPLQNYGGFGVGLWLWRTEVECRRAIPRAAAPSSRSGFRRAPRRASERKRAPRWRRRRRACSWWTMTRTSARSSRSALPASGIRCALRRTVGMRSTRSRKRSRTWSCST
jgi:PAS domain S-box-containing protein